jgi:catechol 2,3-dioxygenase-like lactoylglutathione lyase family enzyme
MNGWSWATIGVADLRGALAFWADRCGFEIATSAEGPDPVLSDHWGLPADAIARQALIRAPGCELGMLHLVEYAEPTTSVRAGAQVFDRCPKNLDIYVDDMATRVADLRQAGFAFRSEAFTEATSPDGVRFREIHLAGHDDINLVLLQLLDDPPETGASGFLGIGPLVTTVADPDQEKVFYRDVMGLEMLHDNILAGPEIERMIGLPAGAALDVSIWGRPGEHLGQVEIVAYRGTEGADLYPRARPGTRGIVQLNFTADDLAPLRQGLEAAGIDFEEGALAARLLPASRYLAFSSPAGLSIRAHLPTG